MNNDNKITELNEKYRYLKSMVISDRKEEFLDFMSEVETKTNYLKAPASAKYHMSTEEGLLQHSVSVTATMIRLKRLLYPSISDETCVIVGLLHDLGKVGYGKGEDFYLDNPGYKSNFNSKWNNKYLYNDNILMMPHAHRSIYLIQQLGFKLNREEFQAIIAHDGVYAPENAPYSLKEHPLTVLLHFADYWSSQILEDKERMVKE